MFTCSTVTPVPLPLIPCQSITKIQDIHSTPSRTSLTTIKSQKKKEISFECLPQGTKNRFKKEVLALALDTTGALKPWNTPSDDTIIEIWNLVFSIDHPIDEGDTECYRFSVAKTLVSDLFKLLTLDVVLLARAAWLCAAVCTDISYCIPVHPSRQKPKTKHGTRAHNCCHSAESAPPAEHP